MHRQAVSDTGIPTTVLHASIELYSAFPFRLRVNITLSPKEVGGGTKRPHLFRVS